MKKDGIQTRNRKLATKAKKRRPGMQDFFKPFPVPMYGSNYLASVAAAGGAPMTQYYGQMGMQSFMPPPPPPSLPSPASSGSPTLQQGMTSSSSSSPPPLPQTTTSTASDVTGFPGYGMVNGGGGTADSNGMSIVGASA